MPETRAQKRMREEQEAQMEPDASSVPVHIDAPETPCEIPAPLTPHYVPAPATPQALVLPELVEAPEVAHLDADVSEEPVAAEPAAPRPRYTRTRQLSPHMRRMKTGQRRLRQARLGRQLRGWGP